MSSMHAVRITEADGSKVFAGKEGWNLNCKQPEWVGTKQAAKAKANHCVRERAKPGKNLTFTKVEVVPVNFSFDDPVQTISIN